MALPQNLLDQLLGNLETSSNTIIKPKRGLEIFEGTDYPQDWPDFIGQAECIEQLQVAVASAKARGVRLEHTLLASGLHGVGKTTLATLLAYKVGAGFVQTTGPLSAEDAENLLSNMEDGDVLFIDEAHLLVDGGKTKADWLLPFMLEGVLYTKTGAKKMPDVTLVAATTDAGRLPQTILSRFMVDPEIVAYTAEEGALIAANLCGRMGLEVPAEYYARIARAADCNPRAMRKILTGVRDLSFAYPESHPNLPKALKWAGMAEDGLSITAREILLLLLFASEHVMSLETIRGQLAEPGPINYHERQLMARGLISITGRGRKLTEAGLGRAAMAAKEVRASA